MDNWEAEEEKEEEEKEEVEEEEEEEEEVVEEEEEKERKRETSEKHHVVHQMRFKGRRASKTPPVLSGSTAGQRSYLWEQEAGLVGRLPSDDDEDEDDDDETMAISKLIG